MIATLPAAADSHLLPSKDHGKAAQDGPPAGDAQQRAQEVWCPDHQQQGHNLGHKVCLATLAQARGVCQLFCNLLRWRRGKQREAVVAGWRPGAAAWSCQGSTALNPAHLDPFPINGLDFWLVLSSALCVGDEKQNEEVLKKFRRSPKEVEKKF